MLYAFFDGDNIGNTIEILLLDGRLEEASNLSNSIKLVLEEIEAKLRSLSYVEIIIIGGDDLLIKYDSEAHKPKLLEGIKRIFELRTGNSMSCGVGGDIGQAIYNLYLAKLYGKNQIRGLD